MPLMDHFQPPLAGRRNWESFHATWAGEMMAQLNRVLPTGYFAEAQVHVGGRAEVDVASFAQEPLAPHRNGGVAVAVEPVTAPTATTTLPLVFPDEIEVQVYNSEAGPTLVAAIELISPANKDRPDTRIAFAAKCASFLQAGIGLVIIDVITNRQANLHDELIELLRKPAVLNYPGTAMLYAVCYRAYRQKPGAEQADVRFYDLALNQTLPTVPLHLRGGPTVPLALEAAYTEACTRSRL